MSYRYQVGGSLTTDSPFYVQRQADTVLSENLQKGEFCYVLNSRQMGKSSLLVRTNYQLEQQGVRCAALDLTGVGGITATPEQWYKGILLQMCLSLDLLGHVHLKSWWQDRSDLPLIQRMTEFTRELLHTHIPNQSIVIFIDEIDTVLSVPFSTDDFFAWVRYCFNQRSLDPHYNRLTFALFGVANPSVLIQDTQRTPFNIGQAVDLDGFTLEQSTPLIQGLDRPESSALNILKIILSWTGGQPFLTQKLCQLAKENWVKESKVSDADYINQIVHTEIINDWEFKDTPEHLLTISKRILGNVHMAGRLLGIYQQVLAGESITITNSSEHMELLLSGLLINKNSIFHIKNLIYQRVFNAQWIAKHLENLRPYAQPFNTWLSSQEQDTTALLRGLSLQEALAWAKDKQLSDLDYRFLGASQALAKQSAEQELAVEKQERELAELTTRSLQHATQVFADARQQAKVQTRTVKLGHQWIAGIAAGITAGVMLLRGVGVLQGLEWAAFDRFLRRPLHPETMDPRITIVTIDEPDIRNAGRYPLSGQVLADMLHVLNQYQPRGIGLDIYRDVPVDPGHEALLRELERSPNIFGIEQVIGEPIAALPTLVTRQQVGFADQVVDGDGAIRRALLTIAPEAGEDLHFSWALQLALRYLAVEGVTPNELENGWTQLGNAVLKPFEPNQSGFYVGADDGGYQLLLRYRGPIDQFSTLSLTEVLDHQVDEALIRDRLVLVGFTAESVNDLFASPYSNRLAGSAVPMAGVTIHANIVSQLLSAALDGRPLLHPWPQFWQWLWIAGWAGVGAGLMGWVRSPFWQVVVVVGAVGGLTIIAFGAFTMGWWIPYVPAMLTLLGSAMLLPMATARHIERLQLQQTVRLLVKATEDDRVVGQIAIAYLKQVEGQDPKRLQLIEKYLQHRLKI